MFLGERGTADARLEHATSANDNRLNMMNVIDVVQIGDMAVRRFKAAWNEL